jgi:hypothetical protein
MKAALFAALTASALFSAPALAQRTPEPVVNYANLPVATATGKPLQPEQVKQAIVDGAARARIWTLAYEPNGTVLATRTWNDHVIVVAITYTPTSYSLAYRDSVNMKYSKDGQGDSRDRHNARYGVPHSGGAVIHPFYNRYVGELKDAIRAELLKL